MSKPITDFFKQSSTGSLKPVSLFGYKIIQKKVSAVVTPGSRSGVARPKSSVTDTSQKQIQIHSVGSSSQLNKNVFFSSKISPKVSVGNIEQFRVPQKRKVQPSTSKDKINRKKELRRYQQRKESVVKQQIKRSLANVINIYYPEQKHSPLDVSLTGPSQINSSEKIGQLSRSDFHFIEVIGRGGYGKVWKVEYRRSKRLYAMKEMSKALIMMKKSVQGVQNERKLLARLTHPFLANMVGAFHDRQNLYLLMDLLPGGDLRYHIGKHKRFTEQQTRFSIACMVAALEYLNEKKVLHRDIKPENLILDAKGYVHLTDFGIARSERDVSQKDTSGTPGYMAPQVMCKQVHSHSVDYFALGVIGYEFMLGRRPYAGNSRNEIREAILAKQVQIKKSEIPNGWSLEAADFINRLLQRQPRTRLGYKGGVAELKEHPWLKRYTWRKLLAQEIASPLTPSSNSYESSDDEQDFVDSLNQYKLLERANQDRDIFLDYTYRMVD